MAFLLNDFLLRITDTGGDPISGAKLYVFSAGTTTPAATYTTSALSVAHAHPIVADSGGMLAAVFMDDGDYKLRFTNVAGTTLFEVDNFAVPDLTALGSIAFPVVAKSADYTVTSADRAKVIEMDASGIVGLVGVVTANSATLGNGFPFAVSNVGSTGTTQVSAGGGQSFFSSAGTTSTLSLTAQNQTVWLVSRGASGWRVLATHGGAQTAVDPIIETGTAMTDTAGTIAPDFSQDSTYTTTLDVPTTTFAAPTGGTAGQVVKFVITQDGTGSRLITWDAAYDWPGGIAPELSTTAGAVDIFHGRFISVAAIKMWVEYKEDLGQRHAPDVILEEQQVAGTDAGGFTSGAWRVRALNTEVRDVFGYCTLAASQFTLAAGTYFIAWSAPGRSVGRHQTRLRNVTGAATIKSGTSVSTDTGNSNGSESRGSAVVTLAAGQALEINHQCQTTKATNGLGEAANFAETEVYCRVEIWRVR